MGRRFVWGSWGPTWTGSRAPALMGTAGRAGAMSALRTRGGPRPRASGDPQGRGRAHRPRTCPGWRVCGGSGVGRPGAGNWAAGNWEPGAAPELGRLYLPRPRRLRVSAARAPGRYLLSPGRAPSRLPARPGPPWRRAAPALSSAAPASELGPSLTPAPAAPQAAPSPPGQPPTHPDARSQGGPLPDVPLRAAPSGARLQERFPQGALHQKRVFVRFVLFLKGKPDHG